MTTESIKLDSIRLDGGTQQRESIDEGHVAELAEALKAGKELPPGRVYRDGSHLWLARGFHRYHAHRRAGRDVMACEVIQGTKRDAILDACGDNADHGLKRTVADKRKAVLTLLKDEEWSQRSARWIAETCRVSDVFVGNLRAALSVPVSSGANVSTSTAPVVGRDGKTYAAHGSRKRAKPPAKPGAEKPTTGTVDSPPKADPPPARESQVQTFAPSSAVPPRTPPPRIGDAPPITEVLSRINDAGACIEAYAASDDGREVDVPKAAGLLKQVKAVVAGSGRKHVIADDVAMPGSLDTSPCRAALDRWLLFKRRNGGAYKDAHQVELQVKRFAEGSAAEFVAAVDYSIAQNYQGLHAEKTNGFKPTGQRSAPGSEYRPGDEDRSI